VAATADLIALLLRTGRDVLGALEQVARGSPSTVAEVLDQVAAALRWGVPPDTAWSVGGPTWRRVGAVLRLADEAGAAPSALLRQAANDVRSDQATRAELAAAKLGVTVVLPLGLAFLPAFVLLTVVPVVIALAAQVWQ
jgi:pilus assembly protein TadC